MNLRDIGFIGRFGHGAELKRAAERIVLALLALACAPAAWAANVQAIGSIGTSLGLPSYDVNYEHPDFLDVAGQVQLNSTELNGPGRVTLAYFGQAQFGRLGAHSFIGGQQTSQPTLSTNSSIRVSFIDEIAPQNLNPATLNYLRLDIGLSGRMINGASASDTYIGATTTADFSIGARSPNDTNPEPFVASIRFLRYGDDFYINRGEANNFPPIGFEWYPGEEPGFRQGSIGAGYLFGARGYVDIPLFYEDGEDFVTGGPFVLRANALAASSCSQDVEQCVADNRFDGTALIGNARIVDQDGSVVPGAGFTAASAYDYITPPGPLPIPEPATWALLLAGLGLWGMVARRRQRDAAA